MKKRSNNDTNNGTNNDTNFSNEINLAKLAFKKMVDKMPDEKFMHFMTLFLNYIGDANFFDNQEDDDDLGLDELDDEDFDF